MKYFILCWLSFIAFFGHPVFAEDASPERYSHFQYELRPGEGADDAVVLVNDTGEPRDVEIDVSDYVFGKDVFGGVTFDVAKETGASSIRDWVRFYPSERPAGPQDIELFLGGSYPSRLYPLCEKLNFGSLEKNEREQRVVRALNRTLLPTEIGWLANISEWCRGEARPVVRVNVGETVRVPFVVHLPSDVRSSSYQGVIVERSSLDSRTAATIVIRMPGTLPPKVTVDESLVTHQVGRHQMRVTVRVSNEGGMDVVAKPQLLIERRDLKNTVLTYSLEEREVVAGATSEFVWLISRPFFGNLIITPQFALYEQDSGNLYSTVVLQPFKLFVFPPLWIIIVIGGCVFVAIVVFVLKMYWAKRWVETIRSSYITYFPESETSLNDLANQFGVIPRLFAKINNVRVTDVFHPDDVVLVPSIVKKQRREKTERITKKTLNKKKNKRDHLRAKLSVE